MLLAASSSLSHTHPPKHTDLHPHPHPRIHLCSAMADRVERFHFIDCAGPLLLTAAGNLNGSLVPDAIHPSPAGYDRIFSECWAPRIGRLVADKPCRPATYTGTCTNIGGKRGLCKGGTCQVR